MIEREGVGSQKHERCRMDRYSRVAPARPVCLSSAGHLRPAAAGRRAGGAEIGIFTAERYFNSADVIKRHDAALPLHPDHHHRHEPPPPPPPLRVSGGAASDASSQSGRHTAASSEASWNSRSGLLPSGGAHHHSASSVRKMKASRAGNASGGGKKKTGSGSWTRCPCTGRKSVGTVDVISEPRSPSMDARFSAQSVVDECIESAIFKAIKSPSPPPIITGKEEPGAKVKVTVTPGGRAFPLAANDVPNRGAAVASEAFAAAIGRRATGGFTFPAGARFLDDEPPRASLEVFRPIDEDSVMLADPPPPPMAVPRGRQDLVPRAPAVADEEAMSDASSDLFDLESFAASSSYPTTSFRGRGSRRNSNDDDLPYASEDPALSECGMYAPSEASVVWSVATAEGGGAFDTASAANFSSAASACGGGMEEFRFVVPGDGSPAAEFAAAMSRSRGGGAAGRKKGGGFLDSCRCEKAVSVGPTPVRMVRPPAYPSAAAGRKGSGSAARCHPPGRVHVPVRT